jgi:hypothetical protein
MRHSRTESLGLTAAETAGLAGTRPTSRLRKGGLTLALLGAAMVASAPLKTADAAVVYSGIVNIANTALTAGATTNIVIDGVTPFALSGIFFAKGSGGSTTDSLQTFSAGFAFISETANVAHVDKLGAGVNVDASDSYSNSASGLVSKSDGSGPWLSSTDGYFGFEFNPTGSQVDYGWGQITTSAFSNTMTLVDYAYDDSGAAILSGQTLGASPVPEPGTATLVASALGVVAFFRRRRGGAASA